MAHLSLWSSGYFSLTPGIFTVVSCLWIVVSWFSCKEDWSQEWPMSPSLWLHFLFNLLHSLAPEFPFGTFLSLLNFFFCSSIVSWFHWVVYLCFLVAHWTFLKELFGITWQAICRSPFFGNRFLENYCIPLVMSCVLDISCSLKLHCCLHVWRSYQLLQYYSLALGRNSFISQPLLGILRLFQTFSMNVSTPHLLFLLRRGGDGGFLRSYAFSRPHKARLGTESLLFVFPKMAHSVAQVCLPPKPTDSGWLSTQACMPSVKAHSCHPQGAHGELTMAGCLGGAFGVLGIPTGHLRVSIGKVSQVAYGQASWWNPWSS